MSKSTVVEWLNENGYRAYPLTGSTLRFFVKNRKQYDLYAMIIDAQLVYTVWPASEPGITDMVSGATDITINVTGQSPFVLSNYLTASYPAYIRNSENSLIVLSEAVKEVPINTSMSLTGVFFEPCVSLHIPLSMQGVSSINILDSGALTGGIALTAGYQTSLIVESGSRLRVEVGRNEGVPLPCKQIYSLADDCADVISSVNGATANKTGDSIQFVAGNHVNIYSDKINSRIYIGFDFATEDVPTQRLTSPAKTI